MTIQTSLQLFTIREQLEADLEGTLAAVAARGFSAVEPYDFVRRAEAMAAAVSAAGLTAPSGHAFLATPTVPARRPPSLRLRRSSRPRRRSAWAR